MNDLLKKIDFKRSVLIPGLLLFIILCKCTLISLSCETLFYKIISPIKIFASFGVLFIFY